MRKDLQRFKRYIDKKIHKLNIELEQCQRTLQLLNDFENTDNGPPIGKTDSVFEDIFTRAITSSSAPTPPTPAIRKLIVDHPDPGKAWTHEELTEKVVEMIARNEVVAKVGRDPANIVYNSLHLLTRKGDLVKHSTPSGQSIYKRSR